MALFNNSPQWIRPINAGPVSLEASGGKGANLALLASRGFPVPGAFLVTTSAYLYYVEYNQLGELVHSMVDGLEADDPLALAAASEAIRARFAGGILPQDLTTALLEAYDSLGGPCVAVRSSATAEDLPDLSFAGQQDTYLNVVGKEALLRAVVNCWSSLWTARAIGYRARNGISQRDLALAIVVQEMVQSEVSGVLFTANPLNGKRTEVVIEATLGLGEALVSGQVEPDHYFVEAGSGHILSKTVGAKTLSIRSAADGGIVTQDEDAVARQALRDPAIQELAQLGRQAAEFFGSPQDIEWAWASGQFYLLQSRPITSLFPIPAGARPEPLQVWLSFEAVQGISGPMTPLGQDAARSVAAGAAELFGYRFTWQTQHAFDPAAERLWINFTGLIRHRVFRRLLRAFLSFVEPSASQAMLPLWNDPRLTQTEGLSFRTLRRVVPVLMPILGRLVRSLLRPDMERSRFQQEMETMVASFEAQAAAATTLAERVALMDRALATALKYLLPRFVPRFGAGMAGLNLLTHLARGLPEPKPQDVWGMTRGVPHNVTTEMDLSLWETAKQIKMDEAATAHLRQTKAETLATEYLNKRLPEQAQAAINAFMRRYGMRGVGEIDLGRPRWREDPTPIMHVLQTYLQIEGADQAPDTAFARGKVASEKSIQQLAQAVRKTRLGRLRARQVHWAARRMQALVGVRESPKFSAVRTMGIIRAALLESGRELTEAGILAQPADLFFLHLDELQALAAGEQQDWQALVNEHRQTYAREQRRQQVPRLLLSDGQAFFEGVVGPVGVEDKNILGGSPVSPGVVEGVVRVVHDPYEAGLNPGEILVCHGTDPAWTPLFLVAGGLVMEVGGLMTHGSVVAREYGIPAVVGVEQATHRLQTGQRVRVDGTTGQVIMFQEEEQA